MIWVCVVIRYCAFTGACTPVYCRFCCHRGYIYRSALEFHNSTYLYLSTACSNRFCFRFYRFARIEPIFNPFTLPIVQEAGSARVANIVLLGATIPFLGIDYAKVQDSNHEIFQRKGEAIVEMNLKALAAGKEIAEKLM